MKQQFSDVIEQSRIRAGRFASKVGERCGMFEVVGPGGVRLRIIAACAEDAVAELGPDAAWDHVSVSHGPGSKRPPNWEQMCWVKKQFFDDTECVVQFHPKEADYIDDYEVLHLWARAEGFPMPPKIMV